MPDFNVYEWPQGLKKTKQRIEVLSALYDAHRPMSARELFSFLERRGSPMCFSTIYRVLDTLTGYGMIHKAAIHENGMAAYEVGGAHRHYAVCVGCHGVTEIQGCPLEESMTELNVRKFHILGHALQISGYCGDCYTKLAGKG